MLVDTGRFDGGVVTCGKPSGSCCVVASQVCGCVLFLLSVGPAVGVCAPVSESSLKLGYHRSEPRARMRGITGEGFLDWFRLDGAASTRYICNS